MSLLVALRQGRYAVLQGELEDRGLTALGILLEDPETNQLHVRLRRDWDSIAADDPVLPYLEDDLTQKAQEWGAEKLFAWLEENLSANLRTTDRQSVAVDDFDRTLNRLYAKTIQSTRGAATHIPRYTLQVAAGRLLENAEIEDEPADWEEAPPNMPRVTSDMFAAEIVGDSMQPHIPNGSICLFRIGVVGSRNGRLVLVEEMGRGVNDRYTVKRYKSTKSQQGDSWKQDSILLEPLNPEHRAFELKPEEDRYRIIAEFLQVLY
jgi:SOS-response transcriptional repressor LexA